jgi:3D (Asp-Asp-Asp) domain-containing protein
MPYILNLSLAFSILVITGFASGSEERVLKVTATAYNSLPGQTQDNPTLTAWGEKLVPGMKVIAVSRDLIAMGLIHGVKVRIDGLPGKYKVADKLHKRWKRRIDIYMGNDLKAAKQWGKRNVTIRW